MRLRLCLSQHLNLRCLPTNTPTFEPTRQPTLTLGIATEPTSEPTHEPAFEPDCMTGHAHLTPLTFKPMLEPP